MSARTPEEAIDDTVGRLRTVAGCISNRPVLALGQRRVGAAVTVGFAPLGLPAPLISRRFRRALGLLFRQQLRVVDLRPAQPRYRAEAGAYYVTVLDPDGREILAYHWHPEGSDRITYPHLHVSSDLNEIQLGRGGGALSLADLHIATGFVQLRDVVRFLIEELDVTPLRTDWREVLRGDEAEDW